MPSFNQFLSGVYAVDLRPFLQNNSHKLPTDSNQKVIYVYQILAQYEYMLDFIAKM